MAARKTYTLFGIASSTYLIGFILTVVAYSIPWLQPKDSYVSSVTSVGLITACFNKFKFQSFIDKDQTLFDGCFRINSAKFDYIKDYVNPDWFEQLHNMHFACIMLMAFGILMVIGFVIFYIFVSRQTTKRGRPASPLVLAKGACSLWFVLIFIVAILEVVEPSVFHYQYNRNQMTFYNGGVGGAPLHYAGGFVVTIISSICCLVSSVSGLLIFVGIFRKAGKLLGENYMVKKLGASSMDASLAAQVNAEKPMMTREGDAAANGDLIDRLTRREEDSKASHTADDRLSRGGSTSGYRSEAPERDRASSASGRPVPAPRRSVTSKSQDSLNNPFPEEPRRVGRPGGRSSEYELPARQEHCAGSPAAAATDESERSSARRYSTGSSSRPRDASSSGARAPSVTDSGSIKQRSEHYGGARRPDDLAIASGHPRSSVGGGSRHVGSGDTTPMSISIAGSVSSQYDANPSSGYKPKEMAMMRYISERSQALNNYRTSLPSDRRSMGSTSGRPQSMGEAAKTVSPGPKSPTYTSPEPPKAMGSVKKKSTAYTSY